MITFQLTDSGARRIVLAQCDFCQAVDRGLVQTKPAYEDWPSPITDLGKLGWLFLSSGEQYCCRHCQDKHAYLRAQAVKQAAVMKLNDASWRGPPKAPEPPPTAPIDPTARNRPRAPTAPRVNR